MGCVLFEMLTGGNSWIDHLAGEVGVVLESQRDYVKLHEKPRSRNVAEFMDADVIKDPRIRAVLLGMLEPNPEKRMTTAEAERALQDLVSVL